MYVLYYSCFTAYNRKNTTNFTGCKGLKVACLRALWGFCGRGRWEIASIIGEKWVLGRKALGNVCLCGIEHLKSWYCMGLYCFFVVFLEIAAVIWCYIVYLLNKYS